MCEMKADLHLHTHHSDGTDSPSAVLDRAAKLHFDVIAITDHDTTAGISEALEEGKRRGIRVIPGVEITSQFCGRELHLLAYFPPESSEGEGWRHSEIVGQLTRDAARREDRARRIVERLNALGIPLTMEQVWQQATSGRSGVRSVTLGRPHIAAALVKARLSTGMDRVFEDYLKRGRPAWVDKPRADAAEVVALVRRAGGLTSLAHPGLLRDDRFVRQIMDAKVDGLEVYHSRHHSRQSALFRDLALEHHLLVTGGSDCHGHLKGDPLMGRVHLGGADLNRFLNRLEKPKS